MPADQIQLVLPVRAKIFLWAELPSFMPSLCLLTISNKTVAHVIEFENALCILETNPSWVCALQILLTYTTLPSLSSSVIFSEQCNLTFNLLIFTFYKHWFWCQV